MKVGVILKIEGTNESAPRYPAVRALARQAEAEGLDSIWLYDHFLFREEAGPKGQWESLSFLAALAEATARVTLGTIVAAAGFRNPALTTKIATAIDEISGGRFVLGLGAGWNRDEFDAFDIPYDHRVDRFEEALSIIAPLLREGHVDFRGDYHAAPGAVDLPRGPRAAGPPLMIGATGPRMLRLAARFADWLNTGIDPADPAPRLAEIAAACADVGRDPATLALTAPVWITFPDLGPIPPHMRESALPDVAGAADRLAAYAEAGVAHAMVDLEPNIPAALSRLAEAAALVATR